MKTHNNMKPYGKKKKDRDLFGIAFEFLLEIIVVPVWREL